LVCFGVDLSVPIDAPVYFLVTDYAHSDVRGYYLERRIDYLAATPVVEF
tara:strand:- start:1386 stop:1532 length:147 start_codon:yes stop_codon:yes gene_type:complete